MRTVDFPFHDDMAFLMMVDKKICTSRNKKYGIPGDVFVVRCSDFEHTKLFKITMVHKMKLKQVAEFLYVAEGFITPQGFIQKWKEIHPRRGFVPEQEVWVHWFEKV